MIVSAGSIVKSYGTNTILNNISFSIEEGEKTAFVGINGAGKTTLFKIISGELSPDSGEITVSRSASVAYLAQNSALNSHLTVYEELLTAFSDIIETEKAIREMEKKMSVAANTNGSGFARFSEEYNRLLQFYENNDGYSYKSLVRGVAAGLGLDGADAGSKKVSQLSGGQKTRAALGKALLKKPDVLLLDEPTNHLDMDSLSWLEAYLKAYPKTVLFISHDRYFMDAIASKVIEIENGKSTVYSGAYSAFIERKGINFELAQKQYKDNQKEIKKTEESIKLLRSFNRQKTVKRAESIEKRLAKAQRLERPGERIDMKMRLTPKIESGHDVLTVAGVSKSYGKKRLFSDISFEIKKGERVALIGANGIGKTTLLKMIMNETGLDAGEIRRGIKVKTGYYDQERQNLNEEKTIMEQLHDSYPMLTDGDIRNTLAAFLFRGDDVYKQVSALSGGERGRVCLAEIMLSGTNFLILDEPTNHLDIYSEEILENALLEFGGTCLFVSHDRYFINRIATRVIELTNKGIKGYLGNYDYYLQKKSEDEYYSNAAAVNEAAADSQAAQDIQPKSEWHRKKAESRAARKKANDLKKIEDEIVLTEQKIKEHDELLCHPDVFSDADRVGEICAAKTLLEQQLEQLFEQWDVTDGQ